MYDNFDSEIITVDELMEMLYIGKNTAYQLLNSGELRAFKIGKVWKIPKDAARNRLHSLYIQQNLQRTQVPHYLRINKR